MSIGSRHRFIRFLDNLMLPFTSCAYVRLIVVGGRASPRERSHAKDPIVAARCTCMHAWVAPCYETRTSVAPASNLANEGFSLFLFFFPLFCFFLRSPFFFVQSDELCKTSANTRLPLAKKEHSSADNHRYRLQIREMRITIILIQIQYGIY